MKNLIKGFGGFLAVMLISGTAYAAGTIKEYTADLVDVKSGQTVGKYHVTEKKIRMDSSDAKRGGGTSSIIRMDQGKMYILQDEDKTYMEMPFKGTVDNLENLGKQMMGGIAPERKVESLGTEKISGYNAEKSKITTTVNMMGRKFTTTGYEWKAKEFTMPIRTETDKGEAMEMRNIKIGAPSDSVFEIPAGYTRNTQMENMMKQIPGNSDGERGSKVKERLQDAGHEAVNDAIKEGMDSMLKGMMK